MSSNPPASSPNLPPDGFDYYSREYQQALHDSPHTGSFHPTAPFKREEVMCCVGGKVVEQCGFCGGKGGAYRYDDSGEKLYEPCERCEGKCVVVRVCEKCEKKAGEAGKEGEKKKKKR